MNTPRFIHKLILGFGLALAGMVPSAAARPSDAAPSKVAQPSVERPALRYVTLGLDDGRTFTLDQEDLGADRGGVLFWGDWAVYHILVPFYAYDQTLPTSPQDVIRLWNTPNAQGELPAFLIKPRCMPTYPLVDRPARASGGAPYRPKVTSLEVGFADGRRYKLTEAELDDPKSGVIFWSDFAVENLLVPFYRHSKGLPTTAEAALAAWHGPVSKPRALRSFGGDKELPAFFIKPRCMPTYPLQ